MTEKVVEDVEDSPVVASGDDTETAPVADAPTPATTTEEEKTPAVESSGDAEVVIENGNGEAAAAKPVEEAGRFTTNMIFITQ